MVCKPATPLRPTDACNLTHCSLKLMSRPAWRALHRQFASLLMAESIPEPETTLRLLIDITSNTPRAYEVIWASPDHAEIPQAAVTNAENAAQLAPGHVPKNNPMVCSVTFLKPLHDIKEAITFSLELAANIGNIATVQVMEVNYAPSVLKVFE